MFRKTYRVGGAVRSQRYVYVKRQQDEEFKTHVLRGSWVEIVGCRVMGKTSLALRNKQLFATEGLSTAYVDLAGHIGWDPPPASLRDWLAKIGYRLAYDLQLPTEPIVSVVIEAQDDSPGALLERLLLEIKKRVQGKLLIILDEVDVLARLDYGEQFVSTLRAFKTDQEEGSALSDISFCFIGLRSISRIASEKGGSASQLADEIFELSDFDEDADTVDEMVKGLPDDDVDRQAIVRRALYYSGGQPLLTMHILAKASLKERLSETDVDDIADKILKDAKKESGTHLFIQIQNIIENFAKDFAVEYNPEQASPAAIYRTYLNLLDGVHESRLPQATGAQVLLLSGLLRPAKVRYVKTINGRSVTIEPDELEIKNRLFEAHFTKSWVHGRQSELARQSLPYALRHSGERKRIFVLNTGGTAGMVRRDGHVVPPENPEEFKDNYRELDEVAKIEFKQHFNVDSINVYPADWAAIAAEIYERIPEGYSGFVVAHGTDTMAYTASAVAFSLGDRLRCPIVFTGAQAPPDVLHGDARVNLNRACRVALQPIPEVVIAFGTKVLRACRAQKRDDKDFEGFESPNYYPLAYITEEIELRKDLVRTPPDDEKEIDLRNKFADKVLLIQQYPGLSPAFFDDVLENIAAGHRDFCHGIIIQTLGAGNVATRDPYSFIPFISEAIRLGVPVIITSIYPPRPEGHTEYGTAIAPIEAGAIYAGTMTAAAALTKFSWVLAQAEEIALGDPTIRMLHVRQMMERNYIGEIDEPERTNQETNSLVVQ